LHSSNLEKNLIVRGLSRQVPFCIKKGKRYQIAVSDFVWAVEQ
jgi:hypothetical protein